MKRGYTLVELFVVLAIVGICAALVVPLWNRALKNSVHSSCASNQKQIGLGLMQYAQDFGDRLPPASIQAVPGDNLTGAGPYGWIDALQPYVKSHLLFHCTENEIERPQDSREANFSDYYLNINLARRNMEKVLNPASVIAVGEGNPPQGAPVRDLSNSRYARSGVPLSWNSGDISTSPLYRHASESDDGRARPHGCYLFVDGHVKYLEGLKLPFSFRAAPVQAPPKKRSQQANSAR